MQVASIVVEGQVCRDMYDEHPGLAYFYMDGRRQVPISHPLSMADGKALAESAWQRYHGESRSADEYVEYDGQFTPSRVLLLNSDEAVLQCYEGNGWLTEFDSPEQWAAMLTQAGELTSEASIEAGWDNFSTAKGLRAQATHLRRRVSISQAHFGMLPAPKSRPKPPAPRMRGLDERVALALARITRIAYPEEWRSERESVERAAEAVGRRDYHAGLDEPPIMFADEPILLKAWAEGRAEAADLE